MTQFEAAAAMGVDEMTLVGWELNRHAVSVAKIPGAIRFLGYVPEDLFLSDTVGQRIKRYRLLNGLRRGELAKRLRIDEGTLCRVESGRKIQTQSLAKILNFLDSLA